MKLAFLTSQQFAMENGQEFRVALDAAELAELAAHLGEPVLLTELTTPQVTEAFGQGRLLSLGVGAVGSKSHFAEIEMNERFANPVELPLQTSIIRDTWRGLDEAVFNEVLLAAAAPALSPQFDETAQTHFELEKKGKDTDHAVDLVALQISVRSDYSNRCAMTGLEHAPEHPVLAFPIQPTASGGLQQPDNCIALVESAGNALNRFQITIGEDMQIVADLSRIDPELMEAVNADGRLRLPKARAARPGTDALSWHRQQFFRRIGAV